MLKKIITTMLIVSILPINVFAASPQTKQMIQDTLSKFCIPPKKENCNPREEGKYDPNYDFCLCENDGMVYSKSGRKCVECGKGTYYKRNMKDNSCKFCSPGTYQDKEGQSSCKDCEAGKYQPYGGQSKCETCDANACYKVTNNRTKCEYDCTTPNLTACSRGTCVQCTSDSYCSGSTPYCSDKSCVECTSDDHCSGNYVCNNNGSCVCGLSESDCKCGKSNSGCSCISPETNCPCGSSDGCKCDAPDECDPNTEVRSGRCGCKPKPEPEPDPEPTPPPPAPEPESPKPESPKPTQPNKPSQPISHCPGPHGGGLVECGEVQGPVT